MNATSWTANSSTALKAERAAAGLLPHLTHLPVRGAVRTVIFPEG
jgi:hypothetical protein